MPLTAGQTPTFSSVTLACVAILRWFVPGNQRHAAGRASYTLQWLSLPRKGQPPSSAWRSISSPSAASVATCASENSPGFMRSAREAIDVLGHDAGRRRPAAICAGEAVDVLEGLAQPVEFVVDALGLLQLREQRLVGGARGLACAGSFSSVRSHGVPGATTVGAESAAGTAQRTSMLERDAGSQRRGGATQSREPCRSHSSRAMADMLGHPPSGLAIVDCGDARARRRPISSTRTDAAVGAANRARAVNCQRCVHGQLSDELRQLQPAQPR